jgi:hypothetical protein
MGPPESPTRPSRKSRGGPAEANGRRPRMRRCLLKGANSVFIRGRRANAIAARSAGRRRGSGRRWKAQQDTGRRDRARETERSKPALPGARQKPETIGIRGVDDPARVITTRIFFSIIAATGQAATRDSHVSGEVPCNASVRRLPARAGARPASGSGDGNRRAFNPDILIVRQDWPYIQPV